MSMLMTDQPGDQTNGEATPNGDGAPKPMQRDTQRHALRELVELSEQCATDETDIDNVINGLTGGSGLSHPARDTGAAHSV